MIVCIDNIIDDVANTEQASEGNSLEWEMGKLEKWSTGKFLPNFFSIIPTNLLIPIHLFQYIYVCVFVLYLLFVL